MGNAPQLAPAPAIPAAPVAVGGASPARTSAKPFWAAPTAKVGTGALAGSLTVMLLTLLKAKLPTVAQDPQFGAALTTILTFFAQYLVPERETT